MTNLQKRTKPIYLPYVDDDGLEQLWEKRAPDPTLNQIAIQALLSDERFEVKTDLGKVYLNHARDGKTRRREICHVNGAGFKEVRYPWQSKNRNFYFPRSRVVWLAAHPGQLIPSDYVIAHLDGDKHNDRLSNLALLHRKEAGRIGGARRPNAEM